MCENSFIHTVNVQLDLKKSRNLGCGTISSKYLNDSNIKKETEKKLVVVEAVIASKSTKDCVIGLSNIVPAVGAKNTPKLSIVDEILADFSEYDIDEYQNTSKNVFIKNVDGISPSTSSLHHDSIEELVLTCGSTVSGGTPEAKTPHKNGFGGKVTNVELVSTNRILKSQDRIKNESPESLNCYDFSEETEKCEKISIFRKRRLADKKYEFSEDNTENIIPFNRTRSRSAKFGIIPPASPSRAAQHSFHNFYEMQAHSHRASPSHGFFRSPCGSPVSNRYLRSPPGLRSPNYYPYRSPSSSVATTSAYSKSFTVFSPPRQFNRLQYSPSPASPMSDVSSDMHKYFSDIVNQIKASCASDLEGNRIEDKPICSKKIIKHYVEEDDANSVVTNEDDDCISPGNFRNSYISTNTVH